MNSVNSFTIGNDVLDIGGIKGDLKKVTEDLIQPVKLKDYLYEVEFTDLDWEWAKEYLKNTERVITPGACSSIRSGNFYGRNYDWLYDDSDYYIIRVNKSKTVQHASIGMTGFPDTADERILPFITLDGINDAGVVVNINVVPAGDWGITTGTTPLIEKRDELCAVSLPRYILDNFETALDAVNYIKNYISVYCKSHEELHMMVADANSTYVMEFIENAIVVMNMDTDLNGRTYMTNFYLKDTTVDSNGHINFSTVTDYGAGLERYDILADNISSISKATDMIDLMDSIKYTNAYSTEMDPIWKTEFVSPDYNLTIHDDISKFSEVLRVAREYYNSRTRTDKLTWQTCHTSVYDIANRVMYLQVQEEDEYMTLKYEKESEDFEIPVEMKLATGQFLQPFETPLNLTAVEGSLSSVGIDDYSIIFGGTTVPVGTYKCTAKDANAVIIPGHKYLVLLSASYRSYGGSATYKIGIKFSSDGDVSYVTESLTSASTVYKSIITCPSSIVNPELYIEHGAIVTSYMYMCSINVSKLCLVDLTDFYGEGKEPETVSEAEIKLNKSYYPYSNKLISVLYKANINDPIFKGSINFGRSANTTVGTNSVAAGYNVIASGQYSHAEGNNTTASGANSHAEGSSTTASGSTSHAEGSSTIASGSTSHAEGYNTKAYGASSHAEGNTTEVTSSGNDGHAEGNNTKVSANYGHAEGLQTTVSGNASHAEGCSTIASGNSSHAEGYFTKASSSYQHVQGKFNIEDASGKYADIVGNGTADNAKSNAYTLDWLGNGWFAGKVTADNIPTAPSADGNYSLLLSKANGSETYSWGNPKIIATNITVSTSAFVSDSTYADYPYAASITIQGVTTDYVPSVNFGLNEISSGIFAPIAETGSNSVKIYAKEIPSSSIVIPNIICER